MSEAKQKPDKDAGKEAVKPPEYRRFEDVLKKVIKAPPMKKP
jgi:hypothetical protein